MRVFWGLIALLALAAGVLLWQRTSTTPAEPDARHSVPSEPVPPAPSTQSDPAPTVVNAAPSEPAHEPTPHGEEPIAPDTPIAQDTEMPPAISDETPSDTGPHAPVPVALDDATPIDSAPVVSPSIVPAPSATTPEPATITDANPEPAPVADASPAVPDANTDAPVVEAPAPDPTAGATSPDQAPAVSTDAPVEIPVEAPADALVPQPDGTLLLNAKYTVAGEGTPEKPYIISWDALTALANEYKPREGKSIVPAWIKALDGKTVELTGFIAFPIIAPSADECLLMLNQWDGCCIGVPPTPYDAVEVTLAKPWDLSSNMINFAKVTGTFRTDPYLVNGWLVGLYVMEGARIEQPTAKNQAGY